MTTDTKSKDYQPIETWGAELGARTIMYHHAIGERMGLSATEYKAADIIRRFGPMTAGELAHQTGLTTGAVTGLVDRLERTGFVERRHDKRDRRRVIVAPAKAKYEEIRTLHTPLKATLNGLLEQYDKQEIEAIADFAAKAAEVLKQETSRIRQEASGG